MRRSHVEARSYRYAARQYVSDTHDHKPSVDGEAPAVSTRINVQTFSEPGRWQTPEQKQNALAALAAHFNT